MCCHPWQLASERETEELNPRSVSLGPRRSVLAPTLLLSRNPALLCHRQPRTQVLRLRVFALLINSQVQQNRVSGLYNPYIKRVGLL